METIWVAIFKDGRQNNHILVNDVKLNRNPLVIDPIYGKSHLYSRDCYTNVID